jgi:anaerobic magnesium-protoporphyrin IX monomethyl ester cyclase
MVRILLINIYSELMHGKAFPIPYPLGILKVYAETKFKNEVNIKIVQYGKEYLQLIKSKIIKEISLFKPHIIGFTCNVWNKMEIIFLSKLIKKEFPNTLIIVGGKEVDLSYKEILIEGNIDLCVIGEGEITFTEIIKSFIKSENLNNINGIVYKNFYGRIIKNPHQKLIDDLNIIPSPYLSGVFGNNIKSKYIIIETSRGCPFNCSFCKWTTYGKIRNFNIERVLKEIIWVKDNLQYDENFPQILYFTDSDLLVQKERAIEIFNNSPYVSSIEWTIITNPRFIDKDIITAANNHNTLFLFGIESINLESLKLLNRENISLSPKDIEEKINLLIRYANKNKIRVGFEIILGLPNESEEDFLKTFKFCLKLKYKLDILLYKNEEGKTLIQIFPLLVFSKYEDGRNLQEERCFMEQRSTI